MQKLLVATHNQGKIREYQYLLAGLPLQVTSLKAEGIVTDVEETGATFQENARLKAEAYAAMTGLWSWADDSGLEVDLLDGRPGVHSARYAGPGATDEDRYRKVLAELRQFPNQIWTARFRCVVALTIPGKNTVTTEDTVEGVIVEDPRGEYGFGYDPVFFLPEFQRTIAELPPVMKNQISHRGKAAQKAKALLAKILKNQD